MDPESGRRRKQGKGENAGEQGTLLSRYINEQSAAYREPARRGTRRGETIGYSRKKYAAALLCLYGWEVKTTAEVAGVSYGLLRKWRTEEEFRALIDRHAEEFSNRVVRECLSLVLHAQEAGFDSKKLDRASRGAKAFRTLNDNERPFLDSADYGEELQSYLWRAVKAFTLQQREAEAVKDSKKAERCFLVADILMRLLLPTERRMGDVMLLRDRADDIAGGERAKLAFLHGEARRILSSKAPLGERDKYKLRALIDVIVYLSENR